MNYVPYEFSFDVIRHIYQIQSFYAFSADSVWKSVVSKFRKRRKVVELALISTDDPRVWRYLFYGTHGGMFTLQKLQARDPRFTRIRKFHCYATHNSGFYEISLDDLHSTLIPFVIRQFFYGPQSPHVVFGGKTSELSAANLATVNALTQKFQTLHHVMFLELSHHGQTTEDALGDFLVKPGLERLALRGNWRKESIQQVLDHMNTTGLQLFMLWSTNFRIDLEFMAEILARWRNGDFLLDKDVILDVAALPSREELGVLMADAAEIYEQQASWTLRDKLCGEMTVNAREDNKSIVIKPC